MIVWLPTHPTGQAGDYIDPQGPPVLVWGDRVEEIDLTLLADMVRYVPDHSTFARFPPKLTGILKTQVRERKRRVEVQ